MAVAIALKKTMRDSTWDIELDVDRDWESDTFTKITALSWGRAISPEITLHEFELESGHMQRFLLMRFVEPVSIKCIMDGLGKDLEQEVVMDQINATIAATDVVA